MNLSRKDRLDVHFQDITEPMCCKDCISLNKPHSPSTHGDTSRMQSENQENLTFPCKPSYYLGTSKYYIPLLSNFQH